MDQTEQFNSGDENPSYWSSVGIAALIFAIIAFVLSTGVQYMMVGGGGGFVFSAASSAVVCLIAAFGGMLAVWHYANEYDITFKLGKGALIGLLTGVAIAILLVILGNLWKVIDPGLQQQIIQTTIERMESANVPDERIEAITQQMKAGASIIYQLGIALLIYGIPNVITGMIGVPLFAKEEEDF